MNEHIVHCSEEFQFYVYIQYIYTCYYTSIEPIKTHGDERSDCTDFSDDLTMSGV